MTVRTDLAVDFEESPRIITVAAPSTEISLQDLVDTIRVIEEESASTDDDHLIDAAGKEELGGGVLVGITATLRNAQVEFEPRVTPRTSGTATAVDAGGTTLTDAAATFVTDGVVRGDLVVNFADMSLASVLTVVSETVLTTRVLTGGTENDWDIGEAYSVYEIVQVDISGGNLVANDAMDMPINPAFPSANTQITRTSSSSATLQEETTIQFSSFNGGVTVDQTTPFSGTEFPTGTPQQPVNNFQDARTIAVDRGFVTLFVRGTSVVLDTGDDVSGFKVVGEDPDRTVLTINPGAITTGTDFRDATIQGTLDGGSLVNDCHIGDLLFVDGSVHDSRLDGTITLSGQNDLHLIDCVSGIFGTATPIVDMGAMGSGLGVRNYHGGLTLLNKIGPESVSVDLGSGHLFLDTSVTDGIIVVRGVGKLTNNASGTADVRDEDFVAGAKITLIDKILRHKMITDPVAGTIELFNEDGTSTLLRADLFEDAAGVIRYRGRGSERRERLQQLADVDVFTTVFTPEFT